VPQRAGVWNAMKRCEMYMFMNAIFVSVFFVIVLTDEATDLILWPSFDIHLYTYVYEYIHTYVCIYIIYLKQSMNIYCKFFELITKKYHIISLFLYICMYTYVHPIYLFRLHIYVWIYINDNND
jgi:hypothetical protein